MQRLVVGEQERAVPDNRRVAAECDRPATAFDGQCDIAAELARPIVDVERVLTTNPERDGEGDEVEEVELRSVHRGETDRHGDAPNERRENADRPAHIRGRDDHDQDDAYERRERRERSVPLHRPDRFGEIVQRLAV